MESGFDFIVVGTGFGGSVACLRLAEKGYSVLAIEQGKRYHTGDYPRSNWNLSKYLWAPILGLYGIQKLSFYREASILSGVGVGGGSLVYANTLYIPPSGFFRNSPWAGMADWEKILMPFYRKASFMLGRVKYTRLNREDRLLREVSVEMGCGHSFDQVYVGVNLEAPENVSDPYFGGLGPERNGCTECAGCMVGCRENAKNTLDKNYLYFAEKLGVCILPETCVEKIHFMNGRYAVETSCSTSVIRKNRRTFRSGGLVLAGGTLGTLELMLKQKYKYKTLPRISGRIGHEVRTNAETLCAVSSADSKLNNGIAISSVFSPDDHTHVEIVKYPDRSNAMKWFFGLSAEGTPKNLVRSLNLIGKTLSHPRRFLKVFFSRDWSTRLVIFLVMQTVDNSMRMVWKRGLLRSRMKIRNTGEKKVPAYIEIGQEVMERYARKARGIPQNILLEVFFNRPTTAHILGGCPMAGDPADGVVDSRFRLHGYPDFYVVDGSVIQGNLGVNPGLTIAAQAEYAMDGIPQKPGTRKPGLAEKLHNLEGTWNELNG